MLVSVLNAQLGTISRLHPCTVSLKKFFRASQTYFFPTDNKQSEHLCCHIFKLGPAKSSQFPTLPPEVSMARGVRLLQKGVNHRQLLSFWQQKWINYPPCQLSQPPPPITDLISQARQGLNRHHIAKNPCDGITGQSCDVHIFSCTSWKKSP